MTLVKVFSNGCSPCTRDSKWINRGRHFLIIWFPVLVTATKAKKLNECETCTLFFLFLLLLLPPPPRLLTVTMSQSERRKAFPRLSRRAVNVTERVSSPSNGQACVFQIVLSLTSNLNRPEKRRDNVPTPVRGRARKKKKKKKKKKRMKVVSAFTLSFSLSYSWWLLLSPASQVTK